MPLEFLARNFALLDLTRIPITVILINIATIIIMVMMIVIIIIIIIIARLII